MKQIIKQLIASCAIALLTACGNNNEGASVDASALQNKSDSAPKIQLAVDAYRPATTIAQVTPMQERVANAAPLATTISLGKPIDSMAAQANKVHEMGKPLQVSFGRDVPQAQSAALTQQVLNWQASATGGKAAAISISSTGAKALRIGLLVTKLPESATLRFYSQGSAMTYVVSGKEVRKVLAQNLDAGDSSDAGRTFWGPVIDGAEGTIEIALPAGVSPDGVEIALPKVSHFFMTANTVSNMAASTSAMTNYSKANDGLSCQVDIQCAARSVASDSVAMLYYQIDDIGYQCSGTLLNNTANDALPYLLTANHCIADQTVASTLSTFWLYRSDSCNATSGTYQQVSGGSVLMHTAYDTDSTLLLMNNAPPAGTLFSGWDASPQALNTALTGIHHPKADSQRKSVGSVTGYYTRNATNPNLFLNSTLANSTILNITMTSGITENGSSGSGIFKNISSTNPQVVGQLYGAVAPSCSSASVSNTQSTVYGRFDYAFAGGLSEWLSPTRKVVYRFYNTQLGSHFFTINGTERNSVIGSLPQFAYEGVSFFAYPSTVGPAGLSPVHRFYNTKTGTHFLTISSAEQQYVANTFPQFKYEGISWYAQAGEGSGTMPLYRFYRTDNQTHFYTVSLAERNYVISSLGAYYNYEGIAYYVWPTLN
jgi:lysyl endopeptidase